jgi:hypothetical protein
VNLLRSLSLFVAVGAGVLGGLLCAGGLSPREENAVISLLHWVEQGSRRERLDADLRETFEGIRVTRGITADLVEGRRTLAEAAAALRAESDSRPPARRLDVRYLPGETTEERFYRLAIALAGVELTGDPRREEVLRRLGAERDDLLARPPHGTGGQ